MGRMVKPVSARHEQKHHTYSDLDYVGASGHRRIVKSTASKKEELQRKRREKRESRGADSSSSDTEADDGSGLVTESIAVGESSALESDSHTPRDGDSTAVMVDASTGATINGGEGDAIDGHVDISPVAIEPTVIKKGGNKKSNSYLKWKKRVDVVQLAFPAVKPKDIEGWSLCVAELHKLMDNGGRVQENSTTPYLLSNILFQLIQLAVTSGPMKGGKCGVFTRKRLRKEDVAVVSTLLLYVNSERHKIVFTENQSTKLHLWQESATCKVEGRKDASEEEEREVGEGMVADIVIKIEESASSSEEELVDGCVDVDLSKFPKCNWDHYDDDFDVMEASSSDNEARGEGEGESPIDEKHITAASVNNVREKKVTLKRVRGKGGWVTGTDGIVIDIDREGGEGYKYSVATANVDKS